MNKGRLQPSTKPIKAIGDAVKSLSFVVIALSLSMSAKAAVLCGPNGNPHDTAKYEDKVPKDYIAYGLLDLLNRLNFAPDNKWIESSVEKAQTKASEVQAFYAKRGIRIAEADCVLGQEGQNQINEFLSAAGKLKEDNLNAQVREEQPKFNKWISESFPSEQAIRSECVPSRASTLSVWENAKQCVLRVTDRASDDYTDFHNDSVPFVITPERQSQVEATVTAYNKYEARILAELDNNIKNFAPPPFPELCMKGICLGDPILKHADRFETVSRADITKMINDGRTFCDGGTFRVFVSGEEKSVKVWMQAMLSPKGDAYIGVSSIKRRIADAPRHGHLHDEFVKQVESHFNEVYDRRSPDNHLDIHANMGPFVRVSLDASSNERDHFIKPAETSFCGELKPISW